jgi:nitrite reductase/ring-hydroxylating ferredoxin subunit/uncharacterized membrane protein
MRSAASVKGHPIHPILIAFPIAFLVGALGFDVAGRVADWSGGWTTGAYLGVAAIVSGLIAAVPGLIDYFGVVPPNSSARRRATQHMIINVTALAVFALGWLFRDPTSLRPAFETLVLEALGVGLVSWGGWLGGTLVYRNQIGVDHRYAGAGKWNEEKLDAPGSGFVVVAREDELQVDQMKLVHVRGRRIVLARTEQGYLACDDRCTHRGGPLADGVLICGTVQCPWHGSQFDVSTGAAKAGPARDSIATYPVEIADGEVRLDPSPR